MVLDEALEGRIAEILRPLAKRWPDIDLEAVRQGTASRRRSRRQRDPRALGTAPGLIVPPPGDSGPTVVVLPGPPRELQPMWQAAVGRPELRRALADATVYEQHMLRLYGIPESEIAETLRAAEREGVELDRLEITTCLKRGEVEVVTRYEPGAEGTYKQFERFVRERHTDTLFSDDGSTVDEQVAAMLRERGLSIATAESCTGGLLAGRLTELPGASDYVRGAIVAYSDDVKIGRPASRAR